MIYWDGSIPSHPFAFHLRPKSRHVSEVVQAGLEPAPGPYDSFPDFGISGPAFGATTAFDAGGWLTATFQWGIEDPENPEIVNKVTGSGRRLARSKLVAEKQTNWRS